MPSEIIAIEWVPISTLTLNPSNPRINDAAVEHVAASIRRFGWRQPIVAKPSGEVVAGNTRLKAAQALGMETVPVVRFEGPDLEATAYAIADNRTGEFSSWDDPALAKILAELKAEDALEGVGFSDKDLAELQSALLDGADVRESEIPEPPDEPITRQGDLWILGEHRLLCGDSASPDDLDRLLAGSEIHLVNTDPPYNVRVEPRSNNAIAAGNSSFKQSRSTTTKMRAKDRPLENDFVSDEAFCELLRAWFGNIARVLLPGRAAYIWGGYANVANYPPALRDSGLYFSQTIIWVKEHPVLTRKDFMGNHEWCFYGWREGAAHRFFGPANVPDVWDVKKISPQKMVHLTEKPVELAARALRYSTNRGENVLDLFGGSGSTLCC